MASKNSKPVRTLKAKQSDLVLIPSSDTEAKLSQSKVSVGKALTIGRDFTFPELAALEPDAFSEAYRPESTGWTNRAWETDTVLPAGTPVLFRHASRYPGQPMVRAILGREFHYRTPKNCYLYCLPVDGQPVVKDGLIHRNTVLPITHDMLLSAAELEAEEAKQITAGAEISIDPKVAELAE